MTDEQRARTGRAATQKTQQSLTLTEICQLTAYANTAAKEGWYYGPKEQFMKRHQRIMSWLADAAHGAESK